VLSIATGSADWEFAHARGKNPAGMEYVPYAAQTARGILQGALDCAEAAGRGDAAGLRQLLECLALEVQLCNFLGHSRPEEGSEHYFAYAIENRVGKGLPHGDLVGPGILLMGQVQGLDTAPLRKALVAAGARLDRLPEADIRATWAELPEYCVRHGLAYGVAHDVRESALVDTMAALRG
jgi:glycerol-1-phosphate dehydrogenase [NAD(P)+]